MRHDGHAVAAKHGAADFLDGFDVGKLLLGDCAPYRRVWSAQVLIVHNGEVGEQVLTRGIFYRCMLSLALCTNLALFTFSQVEVIGHGCENTIIPLPVIERSLTQTDGARVARAGAVQAV
jgi:hypothetical protein